MQARIAPSILAADFSRLGDEVRAVESAGAHQIHVDVMDGHFVPNLSMGPIVVSALRKVTRLPLDVHLMITDPLDYFPAFQKAGANHISFHIEARSDPIECIRWLRAAGLGVGLAINPDTPADRAMALIPHLDMILVMTVYPGFGGQKLMPATLEKIPQLRAQAATTVSSWSSAIQAAGLPLREGPLDVQVDGGIDATTIRAARNAGANVFVAGSSIFSQPDSAAALRTLLELLR